MNVNICLSQGQISSQKPSNTKTPSNIVFGSSSAPVFKVKNQSFLQKFLPVFAFSSSSLATIGYAFGSAGLFYDSYKENNSNVKKMFSSNKPKGSSSEGVQTIKTSTDFGKMGLGAAKIGIVAAASSGIACGLGEGIPMMALGEATNLSAGPIVETPIGTGLFGIGIASIFSGLALDNTPELKLNHYKMMAEKDFSKKAKMVAQNMKTTIKEIGTSVFEMVKNLPNPKFFKENIFGLTPKTLIFQESINKDGKVTVSRALRHNKNYLMHAASFTLALGGAGVILFSLLDRKKTQKASLHVEEGGFLFDNLGMTKYGVDKITTGGKMAGSGYVVGGVINSVSQFMGIDNKNGRALQWLGIALVFLGFSVDRGRVLKKVLATSKTSTELTDVVREWKVDLSKLPMSPNELKKLLNELKNNKPVTNDKFKKLEQSFISVASGNFKNEEALKRDLCSNLGKNDADFFEAKKISDFEETKRVLAICSEKTFGSKNPKPVG